MVKLRARLRREFRAFLVLHGERGAAVDLDKSPGFPHGRAGVLAFGYRDPLKVVVAQDRAAPGTALAEARAHLDLNAGDVDQGGHASPLGRRVCGSRVAGMDVPGPVTEPAELLDPRWEWIDVSSLGQSPGTVFIRGECRHLARHVVESTVTREPVAQLCGTCDVQLPPPPGAEPFLGN
jgi:hypothetical protein